jgi:hypothetical protein
MSDFWDQLPGGIATEVISNIVWIVLAVVIVWLAIRVRQKLVWWYVGAGRKLAIFIAFICVMLGASAYFQFLSLQNASYTFAITTAVICAYLLYRFRRLGIIDVFTNTVNGIDYSASLRKPRHSFDFLGVGAHKLTSAPEFREMIKRCAKAGRPVRLLLSHPDNPVLRNVASRAGTDRNTYASRVRKSLKIVADLAIKEGYNIIVRFYYAESPADFQQFRLVFIDDRFCIMSYTIWDDQEGRNNPQVILNAGQSEPPSTSLYYAFKDYFERVWTDGKTTDVDLSKYR